MKHLKVQSGMRRALILIGLVYALSFVYSAQNSGVRLNVDSQEYLQGGRNFWNKGTYYCGALNQAPQPAGYSRRPPLYSVLAALTYRSQGHLTVILQIALSFLSAWMLWTILGVWTGESWSRLLIFGLFLLYPAQIIYSNLIMAEVLLQFLLVLAVFALSRYLAGFGSWGWILVLNCALAAGLLTKPVLMYVWIPNMLFHLWLFGRRRHWALLVAPLVPVVALAGWSARNWMVTGYFHFTSQKATQMMLMARESREAAANAGSFAEASRAAESAYIRRTLREWPRTLWRQTRGAVTLFLDPGRFDFYEFLDWPHDTGAIRRLIREEVPILEYLKEIRPQVRVLLLVLGGLNVVVLGLFIGWVFRGRAPLEAKVFVVGLVVYVALVTGPIGTSRYRLPVQPLLFLGAVGMVEPLLSRRRRREGSVRSYRSGSSAGSP